MGFRLVLAYGNAHTDVFAYRKAGILPENTHIVGKRSGGSKAEGMVALGNDFLDHLEEICSDCEPSDQSAVRGKPAVSAPDANA